MLIGFEYIGGDITLDNSDFDVEYYTRGNEYIAQKFEKRGSSRGSLIVEHTQTGNTWYAVVDTTELGTGDLMMKLTIYIPAPSAVPGVDNTRKEIGICQTDVIIVE